MRVSLSNKIQGSRAAESLHKILIEKSEPSG